jgi:hypothetical protein
MNKISRRQFVVASALAFSTSGISTAATQKAEVSTLRDVGRKFNADGTVKRFGGNTFIGHVRQQGDDFELFDTLLNIYREFPGYSFSSKISLTPPSSYHITVFGGLNDEDIRNARWPRQLSPELSVDAVTQTWLRQLQGRSPIADHSFEFELGTPSLKTDGAPHIPLHPADDATAKRLAALRNDLSELTGIRDQDHDRYQHHLTFGYVHRLLTGVEAELLKAATGHWIEKLSNQARRLRIPAVQFCSFQDMYAFRVLHEL